jgi:hypothetical protein
MEWATRARVERNMELQRNCFSVIISWIWGLNEGGEEVRFANSRALELGWRYPRDMWFN